MIPEGTARSASRLSIRSWSTIPTATWTRPAPCAAADAHNLKLCFKDEYDRDLWTYPEDRSLKRKRAVVKDEPEPQPSTPRGSLNIRIRDQTGEETFYKVKYTTKFDTIFNKYATRKGVAATLLRFLYDGQRVRGDETPGKCGTPPVCMEDGDQIDCMLEQGGC